MYKSEALGKFSMYYRSEVLGKFSMYHRSEDLGKFSMCYRFLVYALLIAIFSVIAPVQSNVV